MSFHEFSNAPTLRLLLRAAPPLSPEDSLERCIRLMREGALQSLPVVRHGHLVGMVGEQEIARYLAQSDGHMAHTAEVQRAGTESVASDEPVQTSSRHPVERSANMATPMTARLQRPVSELMRAPAIVIAADSEIEALRALCARHTPPLLEAIPVVDRGGYLLGIVTYGDLLAPRLLRPRLATVGGMATPFGVYLTDGNVQAGVGNLALMTSGMVLSLMLFLSRTAVEQSILWGQRLSLLPHARWLDLDYSPPYSQMSAGLASIALNVLTLIPFFVLMRFSPLAGYHAAEHQTVHALERDEALDPVIVERMPRPHPRCGTNLMAGFMLFFTLRGALNYLVGPDSGNDLSGADLIALLATLFTWRRFGTFLQAHWTTRVASARELASGIAAGSDLLAKSVQRLPARPNPLRRFWYTGLPQNMLGATLMGLLIWGVQAALERWTH